MRWWGAIGGAAALLASDARADSVAFTCGASKNVEPLTRSGACVGFIAKDGSGKVVQRVDELPPLSGTILATPDGRSVALLQDYAHTGEPFATLPALLFYRNGKEVARYGTVDLVQRMQLVTRSVSHVRWVMSRVPREPVLGGTLELTTTSQRTYVFDTTTGKQRSADDTDDWKTCELIVYAAETVPEPQGGVFTMAAPRFAKGHAAKPLRLRAEPRVDVRSGTTMCVMRDKTGFVAVRNLPVMFNTLPASP